MLPTMDQLEDELLALPVESRERLAISLYDSLATADDVVSEFSADQVEEFQQRAAEYKNGAGPGVPYEVVLRRVDQIIADQ